MTSVPANRVAACVLVNGTTKTVGNVALNRSSCTMIAGRSPAWVWPAVVGRRTRQTSPRFIRPALRGQLLDQGQRVGARLLPRGEFRFQFRGHLGRSIIL